MEAAAMYVGPPRGPFAGLSARTGFSERQLALAAVSGRLAAIIRLAEIRDMRHRYPSGHLTGAVALAQLRARQVW